MKLDKYPIMEINKQLIINIFKQENDVAATAKNIVDVIAIQQANRYQQGEEKDSDNENDRENGLKLNQKYFYKNLMNLKIKFYL